MKKGLLLITIFFIFGCNNIHNLNYKSLSQEIINYKNTSLYSKGTILYKKCSVCHGQFGEKRALNISQPINRINNISTLLKKYKNGQQNKYGKGSLMKAQLANLNELDISTLSIYISKLAIMSTLLNYKNPIKNNSTHQKIIYTCSELSETESYSLLHMGHNYLDKDGDGHPCEWGQKKSSYSSGNCYYVRGYYRKNGTYVRGHRRCR